MAWNKLLCIVTLVVLSFLLVPIIVHAQITIRFEGLGHVQQVGTLNGIVFGGGWVALVDFDADGGGTNIAHEPSPSTAAILNGGSALDRRITFPQPVKNVSFFYSLNTDGGLPDVSFYSADDILLGTVTLDVCGATFCGNECTGDPTGDYCSWTELTYTSSSSHISYMEFSPDALTYYFIDNLTLQNPLNRNGFWAPPGQIGGAIAIDIRGDDLAVGWGAYDKDTGEPAWMYAECTKVDANTYSGPLWNFAQGQCFDCPYTAGPKVQQQVGDITITFQDDTTAIMNALGITKVIEKVE